MKPELGFYCANTPDDESIGLEETDDGVWDSLQSGPAPPVENADFLLQPSAEMIALDFEIIARLEIQPKAIAHSRNTERAAGPYPH